MPRESKMRRSFDVCIVRIGQSTRMERHSFSTWCNLRMQFDSSTNSQSWSNCIEPVCEMSEAKKEKKRGTGNFFSLPRRFYARKFFSLRKKTCATSPCRAVQITGNTVTYNAALATQHQRLESPCPVVCRLFRVTLPPPLFKNMQQETGLAVRSSTPFNRVYGRAMKKKIYL